MRRAGHSFGGVLPGLRVFLIVYDIETPTNRHSSTQFCCSTTESNINFTYRHSNYNRRLLLAPLQYSFFSVVWTVLEGIIQNQLLISYLKGNT
jgi:hypothetical protein